MPFFFPLTEKDFETTRPRRSFEPPWKGLVFDTRKEPRTFFAPITGRVAAVVPFGPTTYIFFRHEDDPTASPGSPVLSLFYGPIDRLAKGPLLSRKAAAGEALFVSAPSKLLRIGWDMVSLDSKVFSKLIEDVFGNDDLDVLAFLTAFWKACSAVKDVGAWLIDERVKAVFPGGEAMEDRSFLEMEDQPVFAPPSITTEESARQLVLMQPPRSSGVGPLLVAGLGLGGAMYLASKKQRRRR